MPITTQVQQPILVVEDSDVDYETVHRAFKKGKITTPLIRCEDGDTALDYLYRRNRFADPLSSPRPALVLLDLNLPGTDGREVLEAIKNNPELRDIPVVILTTSNDTNDIEQCYKEGANSYLTKPINFTTYIEAVQRLHLYWFETVMLPDARK
jgi:CheY-like chemotaxis protein